MGFWSGLGKIAKVAAPFVAAPFTGGASLMAAPSALGSVLGGAAKGRQDQKNFQSRNDLDWERLRLDAPAKRANTAMGAGTAKNYTRRKVNWGGPGSGLRGELPTFSGGTRGAQEIAAQDPLVRQMLDDAIAGKNPTGWDTMQRPKSSVWDKILGGAALGSSIYGAIRGGGGGQE